MSKATDMSMVVELLTDRLGPPLRDPDRALYRWRCPICGGGYDDQLYRPLVVADDGWIVCQASLRRGYLDDESCPFTVERLAAALEQLNEGGRHE